jgi:hypothetical protein
MPTEQKRQVSEHRTHNIEDLIASENDPKQRSFLIVLNSINNSLLANTETIRDISQKLDEHLTNFEKHTAAESELINKGKGAWTVAAWVLGAAQVAVLAGCGYVANRLESIETRIHAGQTVDAQIWDRLSTLEGKKP